MKIYKLGYESLSNAKTTIAQLSITQIE